MSEEESKSTVPGDSTNRIDDGVVVNVSTEDVSMLVSMQRTFVEAQNALYNRGGAMGENSRAATAENPTPDSIEMVSSKRPVRKPIKATKKRGGRGSTNKGEHQAPVTKSARISSNKKEAMARKDMHRVMMQPIYNKSEACNCRKSKCLKL